VEREGNIKPLSLPPMQINAKSFFLTYPRCSETKESLHNFITALCQPNFIIVGRELHEDGEPHLHTCFTLDAAFRSRDPRCFDFKGHHPNIVRPRAILKCIEYCSKGGDTVSTGEPPAIKKKWTDALACTTKDEFMASVAAVSARDFVINHERLEYFANKRFKIAAPIYVPQFTNFVLPQELLDWQDQRLEVSVPAAPSFH